ALGDIDGDGDTDLVVGHSGEPNRFYLNTSGAFDAGQLITADSAPTMAIAVGDIDGVSGLDVIAGNDGQPSTLYRYETIEGVSGYSAGEAIGADPTLERKVAKKDPLP